MKKSSQASPNQAQSQNLPKFLDIEQAVFTQIGQDLYIGRDKIPPVLRSSLRDEAKTLQTSRLWEILNASATNEAYLWALDLSKDFELVQSAKMLKHWVFFMQNLVHILAKSD